MPFNQLILPLLGGYLLITYANCFIYWSSRQSKEQLLFASAFAGAVLAIVARAITLLVAGTEWGMHLYHLLHARADYEGIGTASLALVLGIVLVLWINRSWPASEAGLWLYGRGSLSQLEGLFFASFNGSIPDENADFPPLPVELTLRMMAAIPLLGRPLRERLESRKLWKIVTKYDAKLRVASPAPIMVTMKDRKVYVGLLQHAPSVKATGMSHLNLEVLLSGYRHKDDLSVHFTDDYTAIFAPPVKEEEGHDGAAVEDEEQNHGTAVEDEEQNHGTAVEDEDQSDGAAVEEEEQNDGAAPEIGSTLPSFKVLPISEISSASFFDVGVFEKFQVQRSSEPPQDRLQEEDQPQTVR